MCVVCVHALQTVLRLLAEWTSKLRPQQLSLAVRVSVSRSQTTRQLSDVKDKVELLPVFPAHRDFLVFPDETKQIYSYKRL